MSSRQTPCGVVRSALLLAPSSTLATLFDRTVLVADARQCGRKISRPIRQEVVDRSRLAASQQEFFVRTVGLEDHECVLLPGHNIADLSAPPIRKEYRPLAGLVMFPIGGYTADHARRVRLVVLGSCLSAAIVLIYTLAPSWEVLAVAALLQGFVVFQLPARSALIADSLLPEDRGRGRVFSCPRSAPPGSSGGTRRATWPWHRSARGSMRSDADPDRPREETDTDTPPGAVLSPARLGQRHWIGRLRPENRRPTPALPRRVTSGGSGGGR